MCGCRYMVEVRGRSFCVDVYDMDTLMFVGVEALKGELEELVKERNVPAIASRIADAFSELFHVKTFYVGDNEVGIMCWDGNRYVECENLALEFLEMVYREFKMDEKRIRRTSIAKEMLFAIKRSTAYDLRYEPMTIAFKNLVFDWERFLRTGSILASVEEPSPDRLVFHYVPHRLAVDRFERFEGLARFDGAVASRNLEELARRLCPRSLKAFRDWVGEKWVLLFEIIGYCLYPRYDLHKAIMLVGDGSNGKSTYLRLVKDILGFENVVSIPLQDLVDESKRFVIAQLYHKLANIYADLPSSALKSTGRFKMLTGEDPITADRKFRSPITFVNYAKLIFSANELPRVYETTPAFWRRWIVVEFPNRFPTNPRFYEETFTEEEKEGIIIVSLYAFRNVWLRRRFSFEETEADYREKWLRETNSVYAFVQDLLSGRLVDSLGVRAERDDGARVETQRLYELYVRYCSLEEREALPKRGFTMEMERLGFPRVKVRGRYFYKGLKLVESSQQTLDRAGDAR